MTIIDPRTLPQAEIDVAPSWDAFGTHGGGLTGAPCLSPLHARKRISGLAS
jgi:hypothetical protein